MGTSPVRHAMLCTQWVPHAHTPTHLEAQLGDVTMLSAVWLSPLCPDQDLGKSFHFPSFLKWEESGVSCQDSLSFQNGREQSQ